MAKKKDKKAKKKDKASKAARKLELKVVAKKKAKAAGKAKSLRVPAQSPGSMRSRPTAKPESDRAPPGMASHGQDRLVARGRIGCQ